MRRVIIVQARVNSTRLPGKILKPLAGRPMLAQQLKRLRNCREVDEICIATTTNGSDDAVEDLARQENVDCFRGSENDVLSRFAGAAQRMKADVVVRLTADCPLISPEITDWVITDLMNHVHDCDFVSNAMTRTFPVGVDTEAMFADTLFRVERLATSPLAREHVTAGIYGERPHLFLCRSLENPENHADLHWTVDTPKDFQAVEAIYEGLDLGNRVASYRETVEFAYANSQIRQINADAKAWSFENAQKTSQIVTQADLS